MAVLIPLEKLTERFRALPGIGRKTAARLALSVVDMSEDDAKAFADAIIGAKQGISRCPVCNNLCETGSLCTVCDDATRDRNIICVVEDARAVMSMERVRDYNGLYHVLGGTLSPMDGRGPKDIRLDELVLRVEKDKISEVIIATNPTPDGETTAMYIAKLLKPMNVRVSRLAYGIPVGGDLEYADEMTLLRAFQGRREFI